MMEPKIFFQDSNRVKPADDDFHWTFNDETIHAELAYIRADLGGPGRDMWNIQGINGSMSNGTYFSFQISIPYEGEGLLDKTYKFGDGQDLNIIHFHSVPPIPNMTVSMADDAELSIRLDPTNGTAEGDFNANFYREGYRLKPNGTFRLTLQRF